jgi:inner membrane protein
MDSFTQLVLGAACMVAVTPRSHARRAIIYGAALGTLPDLDALVPFADPLDQLILHRSASHSLLVLPLVATALFWLARRFDSAIAEQSQRWYIGFLLALITHPLLDFFTTYGTQLWWPLTTYPFATGSVFIIDPLFTVPIALALLIAWRRSQAGANSSGQTAAPARWALLWACAYLGLGLLSQQHAMARVRADAELNHSAATDSTSVSVAAAPLTSLMHRVVLRRPGEYLEAYLSILDGDAPIQWQRFASDDDALTALQQGNNFQRLAGFSKGMYKVQLTPDQHLVLSDLRMGSEPAYVFNFDFGPRSAPFTQVQQLPMQRIDSSALPWLAKRLVVPAGQLPSADRVVAPGQ